MAIGNPPPPGLKLAYENIEEEIAHGVATLKLRYRQEGKQLLKVISIDQHTGEISSFITEESS